MLYLFWEIPYVGCLVTIGLCTSNSTFDSGYGLIVSLCYSCLLPNWFWESATVVGYCWIWLIFMLLKYEASFSITFLLIWDPVINPWKTRREGKHPPKNDFWKHIWGAWGSGKYAEQIYESIGSSFELFGHRKRPKTHTKKCSDFHGFNWAP